jgi:hypothetical protein
MARDMMMDADFSTAQAREKRLRLIGRHEVGQPVSLLPNAVQRAVPLNAKLSDQLLTRYCDCVARHAEDTVQVEDMLAATKGPISRRMQIELNALGDACAGVVSGTVKDGPSFQK